jgi:hypothetical protein
MIEKYLDKSMSQVNKLFFETRLRLNPVLQKQLYFQKMVHTLVKMYHRKKLKEELETVGQQLFNNPSKKEYQQSIFNLFK